MTPNIASSVRASSAFPLLSAALAAVGAISTAQAQVQVAGALLINVDATAAPLGALAAITNSGTLGGFFEARFGTNVPAVVAVSGNGTRGMQFDGTDFLEHYNALGGTLVPADPSLTGVNPTTTIEAWVLNPGISAEETVVSWGHRGGTPDGSNMSFNYGWDDRWGAVGHWGGADIGWDPCCNSGSNPQGVPKSGVWHHLVYTFDGTTQRVYSDGILKNSENVALNIFPIPPVVIGAQMANDTVVEPGLRGTLTIGRLRIHSEALTGIQVANNYNLEEPDFSEGGSLLPSGPIHRYSFSNPSGSAGAATIQDLAGTAHGTVKGGGTTFTGSRLTLPGGASASAGYVDLPNGLLSTNGVANGGSGKITFEGWVKNTGTRNWGRVFDLGNGTAGEINDVGGDSEGRDYFFLSGTEGTNPQRHNTSIRNLIAPAGSDIGVGWDTANANRDYHFAVTWDEATGQVLSYENGALVSSITFNPATDTFSNIQDVNVWLGRSQWTGDENFQGEYDEFRIYDRVLPPDQVRQAYAAGPDLVPTTNGVSIVRQPQSLTIVELQSATFTVSLQGSPPVSLQWYRDGAAVAGANTNTLVVNSLLTADSGDQFFVVVSNFFDGIAYNLTSSIATLTVLSEVIPPVLLQGRANNTNRIELIFSEGLRPDEATNAANYGLTGTNAPPILGAALSPDATRVVLTLGGALTGCESYVVSASNVRDVAGNPIAVGSSVTFWYFPVEGMTHRYSFNNAPGDATGATVADVVGGANGVVLNGGGTTTFTGTRLTLSGGSAAVAPYVDLPNQLLSANSTNNGGSGAVTIEGWVKVTGVQNWSRIFDFGSMDIDQTAAFVGGEVTGPTADTADAGDGLDYLFLSAMNGANSGTRQIDFRNEDPAGGGAWNTPYNVANFNQDFHFVVTWDEATGTIRVYENGIFTAQTVTIVGMNALNDVNVWLGRSNWNNDNNMQGEFDEFRMYNRILTTNEMLANQIGGADNDFGALLGLDLVPATNSMVTNTVGNVRVLARFSNLGTQDIAAIGCVMYSSTDSNIAYISADGVLNAENAGIATVTASLGGFIDSEIIEVTQDATPPTVLFARGNSARTIEIVFSEPVDLGTSEEAGNYFISGPSGPIDVNLAVRMTDQSRVLLTLGSAMPCEYITVLISAVADQSPLFNQVADNTPAGFMNYLPMGLQHRYTFNGSGPVISGTIVPNSVDGGGDAIIQGTGASLIGNSVALPGGSSGTAAYVDLPNGLVSTNGMANGGSGRISIEGWVKVTGNRQWSRIFDFGSSGPCCNPGSEITGPGGSGEGIDYLMLSAQVDANVTSRRLEIQNRDQGGVGNLTVDHPSVFNRLDHFVVTWDERSRAIRAYENGVLVTSATTAAPFSAINDVNVWLGRSTWIADQNLQGEFDEFRIYDRVLSTNEIAFNGAIGPDNALGQPLALRFGGTNHVQIGHKVPLTALVDFSMRSNVDLTVSGCVILETSNPLVVTNDEAGLRAVGLGTSTLTTHFSGMSTSIVVTVGYQMQFLGLTSGAVYSVQVSPQVAGPWTSIGTQMAAPDGTINFEDITPRGPQAFYRATLAAPP